MMDIFSNGNGWLIVGVILIIVEMVLNFGYVSISFGIGAIITGGLIKGSLIRSILDTGFSDELLIFGILSVITLVLLRMIFNRKDDSDINLY